LYTTKNERKCYQLTRICAEISSTKRCNPILEMLKYEEVSLRVDKIQALVSAYTGSSFCSLHFLPTVEELKYKIITAVSCLSIILT
jgi:hypothetical protein